MYNAVGQTVKKEEVELVGESSLDDSLINLTGMNISVDFILYKNYTFCTWMLIFKVYGLEKQI